MTAQTLPGPPASNLRAAGKRVVRRHAPRRDFPIFWLILIEGAMLLAAFLWLGFGAPNRQIAPLGEPESAASARLVVAEAGATSLVIEAGERAIVARQLSDNATESAVLEEVLKTEAGHAVAAADTESP